MCFSEPIAHFVALNVNVPPFSPYLCLKSSDDQRKYLMLKDKKLNNVVKIYFLSCAVTAIFFW